MANIVFGVQRKQLATYCQITWLIGGLIVFGVALLLIGFAKGIRDWAETVEYRLENDRLVVNGCLSLHGLIIRRTEKSIPLRKITDVKLTQGPILGAMNLWALQIQTASTGQNVPEATLWALESPHEARDQIIQAIEKNTKE